MAGTLVASTLSDGTNSTSTTNCISGSAKAWVNFDGTTSPGTIRASYNVSSVTRTATGDYTVNFTNALTDANYTPVVSGNINVSTGGANFFNAPAYQAPTTTAIRLATFSQAGSNTNMSYVNVAVFR